MQLIESEILCCYFGFLGMRYLGSGYTGYLEQKGKFLRVFRVLARKHLRVFRELLEDTCEYFGSWKTPANLLGESFRNWKTYASISGAWKTPTSISEAWKTPTSIFEAGKTPASIPT